MKLRGEIFITPESKIYKDFVYNDIGNNIDNSKENIRKIVIPPITNIEGEGQNRFLTFSVEEDEDNYEDNYESNYEYLKNHLQELEKKNKVLEEENRELNRKLEKESNRFQDAVDTSILYKRLRQAYVDMINLQETGKLKGEEYE